MKSRQIYLTKVYLTNEQRVLLSNLKLLIAVRNTETLIYLIYHLLKLNV